MSSRTEQLSIYANTAWAYNNIANEYAKRHKQAIEVADILSDYSRSLPRIARVLDAGCGAGRDAQYFTTYNRCVVAVDFSEQLVKITKETATKAFATCADVRFLPFVDEYFDGVWMNAVIHHIPQVHWYQVLGESHRVLRGGGNFYVSAHLNENELWDTKYGRYHRYYAPVSQESLTAALEVTGFAVTKTIGRDDEDRWVHILAKKRS